MRFIALDTETGGFAETSSLLTAFFQVYDDHLRPLESLSLKLKPDDSQYNINPESMLVNGIDLVEHHKEAISYKDGGKALYEYLVNATDEGKTKLYPIGLGVEFDIGVITRYLISKNTIAKFISVKRLDVMNIALFLKVLGILPENLSHSLVSLASYYGVTWPKPAHDAEADALVSAEVFRKMCDQMKDKVLDG